MTAFGLFPADNPRVRWLRLVLVGATLSGMLCCLPLWLETRAYPTVPLLPPSLILPSSCDPWLLGLVFFSLVAAARFFRPAIAFFLVASLYLFGCDQNREQPWFYIYWVMLLLNFLPEPTALAACRLAFAFVYFWAGLQKLNGAFFGQIPAWFIQPSVDWGWPDAIVAVMRDGVWLTPFLEIFIAVGLWFGKLRWIAIALAIVLHAAALLFLGPIGYDVNLVIWPWNIAMIALIVVLFAGRENTSLLPVVHAVRRSWIGVSVLIIFGMLPLLSFFGWWDSYLSFSLYSNNLARAEIYITRPFLGRLSPEIRRYVYPVKHFNPAYQAPFMLEQILWAEGQLGVPPLPEPRGYRVMFQRFASYATNDDDCWMLLQTRTGSVFLYRRGAVEPIVLKR